jgi:hypothetical protein
VSLLVAYVVDIQVISMCACVRVCCVPCSRMRHHWKDGSFFFINIQYFDIRAQVRNAIVHKTFLPYSCLHKGVT